MCVFFSSGCTTPTPPHTQSLPTQLPHHPNRHLLLLNLQRKAITWLWQGFPILLQFRVWNCTASLGGRAQEVAGTGLDPQGGQTGLTTQACTLRKAMAGLRWRPTSRPMGGRLARGATLGIPGERTGNRGGDGKRCECKRSPAVQGGCVVVGVDYKM